MFLRRLDIFLRFETYVFENPQKEASTDFPICQLDFLHQIYMRKEVKLVYRKYYRTTDFEDFGTHMSQSVEKYLDVVGTWLIVR